MSRKLSDDLVVELTFLTSKELLGLLGSFKDSFDGDRYDTINYIRDRYYDEDIKPLLPPPLKLRGDKKTVGERIKELKQCYQKSDIKIEGGATVENVVRSRGRKKSQGGTLKDRVFEKLNQNTPPIFEEILKVGIVNISENTFKTILSQWRKEKGIKIARGRKKGENKNDKQ